MEKYDMENGYIKPEHITEKIISLRDIGIPYNNITVKTTSINPYITFNIEVILLKEKIILSTLRDCDLFVLMYKKGAQNFSFDENEIKLINIAYQYGREQNISEREEDFDA
jgi:hypothetical protein